MLETELACENAMALETELTGKFWFVHFTMQQFLSLKSKYGVHNLIKRTLGAHLKIIIKVLPGINADSRATGCRVDCRCTLGTCSTSGRSNRLEMRAGRPVEAVECGPSSLKVR